MKAAASRKGGWAVWIAAGLLTALPPVRLSAQDSQFGVRSLGTPGRWESVQARSTGGAFGPFDALSPLAEAAISDLGHLTATAAGATSNRDVEVGGTTTALRATRFPLMGVAGQVTPRLAVGLGFSTYLDRSWDVTLRDSLLVRGALQRYTDEITSDGSVTDIRLAVASRLSRRIAIGGGIHVLSGSTRETAERRFDDSTFHAVQQLAEVRYDGFGLSGSVIVGVLPGLTLAGWARTDNRLRSKVADTVSARIDLPRMAGGGILMAPVPSVRLATAVAWRSWSRAGAGAFDTWSWSAGGEIGGRRHMPFRVGVRGGQLPFGPGTKAPTEFALSTGTGRMFAQGRALIDVGLERLERKGGGLTERVWTVMVGLTVRP